jgi:hypothetical protein
VPVTVAPEAGEVRVTVGAVVSGGAPFETVTETEADVLVLPAPSRATALRLWLPLVDVVVSHGTEYGAVVSSPPSGALSSWN